MGFIYKVTDDIVQFILDQKKTAPQLSCRQLVDLIKTNFQRDVSKSSVHEVLKQAHITSPRGRKSKERFQIPAEKKLAVLIKTQRPPDPPQQTVESPAIEAPLKLIADPVAVLEEAPVIVEEKIPTPPALIEGPMEVNCGNIFLRAAFADLFPRPWRNVKNFEDLKQVDAAELAKEMQYRNLMVATFEVTLEDGCVFYIDPRFQSLKPNQELLPATVCPLEKAIMEMADHLLNNTKAIEIKEFIDSSLSAALYDFCTAMEGREGKNIVKIALLGLKGFALAEFTSIPRKKRQFVVGLSTQIIETKGLMDKSGLKALPVVLPGCSNPLYFASKELNWGRGKWRGFILMEHNQQPVKFIVSNLNSAVADAQVVEAYLMRHGLNGGSLELGAGSQGRDPLKSYAQMFFKTPISDGEWTDVLSLSGRTRSNNQAAFLDLHLPSNFAFLESLKHAAGNLNHIGLKDSSGRLININIIKD